MNYKKKTAVWATDYDMHEDKCYERPCCPDCYMVPIGKYKDENYRCYNCGKIVKLRDKAMIDWFADREETKVEMTDCLLGCEGTMKTLYIKNPITLKWQKAWGVCKKCGARFIV